MAKESKVNERRRRLAERVYRDLLLRQMKSPGEAVMLKAMAEHACQCADALIHEFDERGWQ